MLRQSVTVGCGMLVLTSCGSTLEDVEGRLKSAAAACIQVGEPMSPDVVSCMRREAGPINQREILVLCSSAKSTIGMSCAYLAPTLDGKGNVMSWKTWASHEE